MPLSDKKRQLLADRNEATKWVNWTHQHRLKRFKGEHAQLIKDMDDPMQVADLAYHYSLECDNITRNYYSPTIGQVYYWGGGENECGLPPDGEYATPTHLPQLHDAEIRQVSNGGSHMLALTRDGKVYSWGVDDDGQLGRPKSKEPLGTIDLPFIRQIAASNTSNCCLDVAGRVHMTGIVRTMDDAKCSPVVNGQCIKGARSGPVVLDLGQPVTRIASASGGNYFAAVLKDGYTIMTWGKFVYISQGLDLLTQDAGFGEMGELGRSADMANAKNGEYNLSSLVKKIETDEDGKEYSKFDLENAATYFLTPGRARYAGTIPFPKFRVIDIACGINHMMVIARGSNGRTKLYGTGGNIGGELGVGDQKPRHELTEVPDMDGCHRVAAGKCHTIILADCGHTLYGCGYNQEGQVGVGTPDDAKGTKTITKPMRIDIAGNFRPVFQSISAGDETSFAITMDGRLYSWGCGSSPVTGHATDAAGRSEGSICWPREVKDIPGTVLGVSGSSQATIGLFGSK